MLEAEKRKTMMGNSSQIWSNFEFKWLFPTLLYMFENPNCLGIVEKLKQSQNSVSAIVFFKDLFFQIFSQWNWYTLKFIVACSIVKVRTTIEVVKKFYVHPCFKAIWISRSAHSSPSFHPENAEIWNVNKFKLRREGGWT